MAIFNSYVNVYQAGYHPTDPQVSGRAQWRLLPAGVPARWWQWLAGECTSAKLAFYKSSLLSMRYVYT